MTTPLYQKDPYLTVFTSNVIENIYHEGITKLILEQTCFYPLSGGQPADEGTIEGLPVIRVEKEDNDIVHYVDGKISGSNVTGMIDWEMRRDHMQQHTGQHILSQAIFRQCGADTDSLHIGRLVSTVDIPVQDISAADILAIEDIANDVVFSNTRISTYAVESTDDDTYRKKSNIEGDIRIVEIENYDKTPCGGTHFYSTGEVGLIHVSDAYKKGKSWRVEFVCGRRCISLLRELGGITKGASAELMVPREEIIGKIKEFKERTVQLNREISIATDKLAQTYVETNLSKKRDKPEIISDILDDESVAKRIAQLCTENDGVVCLMGVISDGAPMLIFSASKKSSANAASILKDCLSKISGRGGGSSFYATGKGTDPDGLQEALHIAKKKAWEMLMSDSEK